MYKVWPSQSNITVTTNGARQEKHCGLWKHGEMGIQQSLGVSYSEEASGDEERICTRQTSTQIPEVTN